MLDTWYQLSLTWYLKAACMRASSSPIFDTRTASRATQGCMGRNCSRDGGRLHGLHGVYGVNSIPGVCARCDRAVMEPSYTRVNHCTTAARPLHEPHDYRLSLTSVCMCVYVASLACAIARCVSHRGSSVTAICKSRGNGSVCGRSGIKGRKACRFGW